MTLEQRIKDLAVAIGADIKEINTEINKLGGGGVPKLNRLLVYYGFPVAYKGMWSAPAVIAELTANFDYWIVKLTNTGAIQWQKCLGGTGDDSAHCIKQTTDGGYIIGGLNRSNDGDVTFHYGSVASDDFWIVKLAADILPTNSFEQEIAALYPNPVKDAFSVSSNEPISEVAVYDLLGKCVFTAQNPESEINISALPKGIYVAKLKTETGVSSVKLIKE